MDRPFFYRAGAVVPRDVTSLIIGGSVTVVPPRAFEGCRNLKKVEFQQGVEVIGRRAFANCPNLERIDWASSIRTIGDHAFCGCVRLSEVALPEGLEEIRQGAFVRCRNLERVVCPSSLRTIGVWTFVGCIKLSEVVLRKGLEEIGETAFGGCALERITIPSSVVEIGEEAFSDCNNLEAAALAGGMVLVARGVFLRCPRLGRILIPSIAIVVESGEDGNGRVAAVTGGIEDDGDNGPEPARLILTSRCLALMSQEDRTNMTDAIDQIIDDQRRGAGPLDLSDVGVAHRIRACFANCLAEYKAGVAAILELALWKANMNQTMAEGETAMVNAPARDYCRIKCGAETIVGLVVSYLWGPHRRADQE